MVFKDLFGFKAFFSTSCILFFQNGSCVGPATLAPLLVLCIYGLGYGSQVEPYMKIVMSVSYLRFGLVGLINSIYEKRPLMDCFDEVYCHYKDPELFLRDIGMDNSSYVIQVVALLLFCLLFRMIAFTALRYRLTSEFSNKILNYATKILKHSKN